MMACFDRPFPESEPAGVTVSPSVCTSCENKKAGSDGLCPACRLLKFRATYLQTIPPITPPILQELRCAYAGNVREVSANLNRIAARTGISKCRLKLCANKHGWYVSHQPKGRPWTQAENAYLEESLGSVSVTSIARRLKRTVRAVTMRAHK